jgi:hypothetical protein
MAVFDLKDARVMPCVEETLVAFGCAIAVIVCRDKSAITAVCRSEEFLEIGKCDTLAQVKSDIFTGDESGIGQSGYEVIHGNSYPNNWIRIFTLILRSPLLCS